MSNWKIKRSRKAGTIPHVGQFPDSDTVIWNQTDAKLWGLRVDGSGNKTVVLIGGGINTIGETHQRLHAMDSEADHAADPDKAGRIIMYDAPDGKVIATEFVAVNVDPEPPRILITHDYVNKRLELDVNEQGIDHNNLKNVNVGDFQHITIEEKEDLHPRKHFILNPDDHAPDPDNAGRVIMFDQPDGHPVAIDIVTDTSDSFSVTKNYDGGQMILSVKDEGIDHNLLKNFSEFRHKRMEYSPELGAYLIEP
jgi:hypothetical protein